MNKILKSEIERVFKPLGIVGYSGCCRLGCTGSYDENDEGFCYRDQGILYFKLFLSGMNYDEHPQAVSVQYIDIDFLNRNWEAEKRLIDQWCNLLALREGDYSIERPETEEKTIVIRFSRPLDLDPEIYSDEDEPTLIERQDEPKLTQRQTSAS